MEPHQQQDSMDSDDPNNHLNNISDLGKKALATIILEVKKLLVDDLKKLKDIQFSIANRLRHLQDLNTRIEDGTPTKGIPTIRVPQSMPEAVRDECQVKLDDVNKRIILETNAIFTELRKKELLHLKSEKVKLKLEYKNKFTECIKYFCKEFNGDEPSTNILVYNEQNKIDGFLHDIIRSTNITRVAQDMAIKLKKVNELQAAKNDDNLQPDPMDIVNKKTADMEKQVRQKQVQRRNRLLSRPLLVIIKPRRVDHHLPKNPTIMVTII